MYGGSGDLIPALAIGEGVFARVFASVFLIDAYRPPTQRNSSYMYGELRDSFHAGVCDCCFFPLVCWLWLLSHQISNTKVVRFQMIPRKPRGSKIGHQINFQCNYVRLYADRKIKKIALMLASQLLTSWALQDTACLAPLANRPLPGEQAG